MDNITRGQLAADLKTAQDALRTVKTILDGIQPGADRLHVFHELGRAGGAAWLGLVDTRAKDIPSLLGKAVA